jgi:hypothetical protein
MQTLQRFAVQVTTHRELGTKPTIALRLVPLTTPIAAA